MPKYKVGDKVIIRNDLELSRWYKMYDSASDNVVVGDMIDCRGRIAEITDIDCGQYRIDINPARWTDEMFSGYAFEDGGEIDIESSDILSLVM